MLSFMNFNFCSDKNALDPIGSKTEALTNLTIQNGIFDRVYLTKDLTQLQDVEIPELWNNNTIMDAKFENDLNAGNVKFTLDQIDEIAIKRRKKGELQWITLEKRKVNDPDDLNVAFNDTLNRNNTTYEYALVPILNNVEGNYYTAEIVSKFDGVFVCDFDTIYKFYAGVDYSNFVRVQRVATLEPMGKKFPVVISNGEINYTAGSVTGTILPKDYGVVDGLGQKIKNVTLDREEMARDRDGLLDFLTNKKAKVLKDWSGNLWLVVITGTPAIAFKPNYGMGIADVAFDAVEIGDPENQDDLLESGIVNPDRYEVNTTSEFNL